MKFFIDTANIDQIREVHQWGILAGVTTNPSLVAKEGKDFIQLVHDICELVQGPVSAEVIAQDTAGMEREGKMLAKIHPQVVVKVPLTTQGLGAVRRLTDAGIKTNVTLCFSAPQALLAARAGASYISPFIGRLDDIGWNGTELIAQIKEIYERAGDIDTQVLAASIRHPLHLAEAALAGADVATVPYNVLVASVKHPQTDLGNAKFLQDWETVKDKDIVGQVERFLAKR